MDFLPALIPFLQPFELQMSAPTFSSLLTVLGGWIISRRHTVSAALVAAGSFDKHFSAYHRVFASARWNLDQVGLALAGMVLGLSPALAKLGISIGLVVDDTLCKKRGRTIFGVGMHYDASATGRVFSNSRRSLKANGHCWVILGLAIEFAFRPGHIYCLPVLSRLFLNHKSANRHHRVYRTKVELALEMLKLICERFSQRHFELLADSAYGGKNLLGGLPGNCDLVCRWILNAALYEPLERVAGAKGRPRVHGKRLPGVAQMLQDRCQRVELDVYGKHQTLRVAQTIACFYSCPTRKVKVVAAQSLDKHGHLRPDTTAVFYSTNLELTAEQILQHYAMRWSIEVTIHDAKQQLGLAQPQVWCRRAVQRATPTLLMMYSLTVLWFANDGHQQYKPLQMPWYPSKQHASFADMLATLRIATIQQQTNSILKDPNATQVAEKSLQTIMTLIKQAA